MASGVLLAAVEVAVGQGHSFDWGISCLASRCVGKPQICEIEVGYRDDFGDTLEILEVWDVIDPLGDAIRVPAAGNLEIIGTMGNTTAVVGGSLPVRIGPGGSTLSGLPGDPDAGVVFLGFLDPNDPRNYVIQPDDVGILIDQAQVIVQDLCDDPGTIGCSPVPDWVQWSWSTTVVAGPGDLDYDGAVDADDLTILLANFGDPGPGSPGDADGDGDSDVNDLTTLLANFGVMCG